MKTVEIRPGIQIAVLDALSSQLIVARDQGKNLTFCNETDELPHTCRNCFGLGMILFRADANSDRAEYMQCTCPICDPKHEAEMVAHFLSRSGLQPNEYAWTIERLARYNGKSRAVEAAKRFIDSAPHPVGWVSFYGDYGVGKSGLMKATVAALCRTCMPAIYRRADDILSEAKAIFSEDKEAHDASERAIKARYGRYPFLAIDEVDRVVTTPWSMAFIFSILDERYNARHKLATMIATNALPGRLGAEFGYLEDRMKDGQRIIIAGPSLRGRVVVSNGIAEGR